MNNYKTGENSLYAAVNFYISKLKILFIIKLII